MKVFHKGKDGGPHSNVTGWWLIEAKQWFSIALLRFTDGSRDAFHSHAFNSWSWLLKGRLDEEFLGGQGRPLTPSWKPIHTTRDTFHKVRSQGTSWVLTFRGPWAPFWFEFIPETKQFITLSEGREVTEFLS